MSRSSRTASIATRPVRPLRFCAFALAAVLAACGGGGGGGGSAAPAPAPTATAAATIASGTYGTVTLTLIVPSGATVASIAFTLTAITAAGAGAASGALNRTTIVTLSAANSTCVLGSANDRICTVAVQVPAPATDTFTVYTYAVPNPVVGTTIPVSILVGATATAVVTGATPATVTTNGVLATLAFSPAVVNNVPAGIAVVGSNALVTSLAALDAEGATLVGTQNFVDASGTPGTVHFSGCDAGLTPVPPVITAANPAALGSGAITVSYDGLESAGALHCYAAGPGGVTAQFTVNLTAANAGGGVTIYVPPPQPVICTPAAVVFNVAQRIVLVCSSQGYTGAIAFTVADPTIASVTGVVGASTLFTVSGLKAGTTTLSLLTSSGGAGQESITVNP